MPRQARPTRGKQLEPGISRIDQETRRTHGYFVRVGYEKTAGGWRPRQTAFFGDATHGGKTSALRAAEKWLKEARRSLEKSPAPAKKAAAKAKNATGRSTTRPARPARTARTSAKAGAKKAGGRGSALRH